jgi:hypothetical protein
MIGVMPMSCTVLRTGLLAAVVAAVSPPTVSAGPEETLAKYAAWLGEQRTVNAVFRETDRFEGDSPFKELVVWRVEERVTRNGDEWVKRITGEELNTGSKELKPKPVSESRLGANGSVTMTRTPDGGIRLNVIADPKAGPAEAPRLLSTGVARFTFGYTPSGVGIEKVLGRGDVSEAAVKYDGRPAVEVRSKGEWGECALTLDPALNFVPLRFTEKLDAKSLMSEKLTLGDLPPSRNSYYLPEPIASRETVIEVTATTKDKPARITECRGTTKTVYPSGRTVTLIRQATANYFDKPATGPDVAKAPPGTRAVARGDESGRYVWDGEKAVPDAR